MSQCAAGLSQHPDPGVAIGEIIGDLLARIGPHPDLAVLLVSGRMAESMSEIAATTRALLAPGVLVGAGVAAVIGSADARPVTDAIVVWAANTGDGPPPLPFRIDHIDSAPEPTSGMTLLFGEGDNTIGPVIGAGCTDGGSTLMLDHSEYTEGGVGLVFAPATASVIEYTLPHLDDLPPEGDPQPSFFNPGAGKGLLLFAEESTIDDIGSRFDFEIALQGFRGSLAGTTVSAEWPHSGKGAVVAPRPGRRITGLILH